MITRFSGAPTLSQKRLPVNACVSPCSSVPSKRIVPAAPVRLTITFDEPPTAVISRYGATAAVRCVPACALRRPAARRAPPPDDFQALITTTVTHGDRGEREQDDVRLQTPLALLTAGRAPLRARLPVLAGDEARVVLVDVELAVEAEVVGVGAQEALDVGLRREHVELLLLERAQVLAADLRRLLGLGELDPAAVRASRRLLPISNTRSKRSPLRSARAANRRSRARARR